jgi:putative ABC transport system permease protein
MTHYWTDFRSAWKSLRAAKWMTVAAVATLALGTGANVAVLAVAYGALARPLPFADADRLVVISTGLAANANPTGSVRMEELERWRALLRTVTGVGGWTSGEFTMRGPGAVSAVRAAIVTDNFFDVLGASAATGRLFHGPGDAGLAVLAHATAARAGLDPLGQPLSIGSLTLRVAGTMAPTFPLPDRVDLWVPAQSVDALNVGRFSNMRAFRMVARLAPGVTLAQARDDVARVMRTIEAERNRAGETRAAVTPLRDLLVGDTRPVLYAFVAAAALVLAVACANVATLMVGRAYGRRRELAVRLAMGASPSRLVRTALFESVLIAGAAALAGAALAAWALTTLPPLVEGAFPRGPVASLGLPVLAACVLVGALTTVLAGAAPALAAARSNFAPVFRTATASGTLGGRRTRAALVVVQIAVAVVLLVGAGLLVRTVAHLLDTDLGIDAGRTLTLRLRMTEMSRFDAAARAPFVAEIVRRVQALPGVQYAGVGTNLPPSVAPVAFTIRVVQNGRNETRTFDLGSATSGYFDAIGARLVRGRWFDGRDEAGPRVAVLTETAARHLAGLGDPLGKPLPFVLPTSTGERVNPTVIGIVEDIRHHGLEQPAHGGIYVLWSHLPAGFSYLVVRSAGSAEAIAPAVLRVLRDVDPALPLPEVRTLEQEVHRSILGREMRVALVGSFAVLAAALALAGLSGALARSVTERRRELAIRAALGATPRRTMGLVVRDGLVLQAIGLAIGLGLALALGQSAASLLYGVSPYDTPTLGAVAGGVAVLGFVAAWLPARRAARVNPRELMRSET